MLVQRTTLTVSRDRWAAEIVAGWVPRAPVWRLWTGPQPLRAGGKSAGRAGRRDGAGAGRRYRPAAQGRLAIAKVQAHLCAAGAASGRPPRGRIAWHPRPPGLAAGENDAI